MTQRLVCVGGNYKHIYSFNASTFEEEFTIPTEAPHWRLVPVLSNCIAAAHSEYPNLIEVRDVSTNIVRASIRLQPYAGTTVGGLDSCMVSGKNFLVAGTYRNVFILDAETATQLFSSPGSPKAIWCLRCAAKWKEFIVCGSGAVEGEEVSGFALRRYDLTQGRLLATLSGHTRRVFGVEYPDMERRPR